MFLCKKEIRKRGKENEGKEEKDEERKRPPERNEGQFNYLQKT